MKPIREWVARDPSGALTIVTAAAGALAAALGRPEFTPVLIAVAGAILGLRTQVTPTAKALKTQTAVALEVAHNLTAETVGAAGQITGAAAKVVDDALGRAR